MKHIITLSALTIWSFISCPDACAQFNTISSNSQRPKILTMETDKNEECPSEQYETVPKESSLIVRKVNKIDKTTLDKLTIGGLSKL